MPRISLLLGESGLGEHVPTAKDIEHTIDSTYKASVSHDIRNNNWNNLLEPIYTLVQPKSQNNIYYRSKRLLNEGYIITNNDKWEKLLTAMIIAGFVLSILIIYYSKDLDITQQYIFNHPEDTADPVKAAKLKYLNTNKDTWDKVATTFTIIPGIILVWKIFKRTSVPPPGRERRRNPTIQKIGVASRNLLNTIRPSIS